MSAVGLAGLTGIGLHVAVNPVSNEDTYAEDTYEDPLLDEWAGETTSTTPTPSASITRTPTPSASASSTPTRKPTPTPPRKATTTPRPATTTPSSSALVTGVMKASYFWDDGSGTAGDTGKPASGQDMRKGCFASPMWPLGTKVTVKARGRTATGEVCDFGPGWPAEKATDPILLDLDTHTFAYLAAGKKPKTDYDAGVPEGHLQLTAYITKWGTGRSYKDRDKFWRSEFWLRSKSTPKPSASTSSPKPSTGTVGTTAENEVVRLTNAERAKAGCKPLKHDAKLRAAAYGHSKDMATKGYFDHDSPSGEGPGDRIRGSGFSPISTWGENIAAGQRTAAEVVNGWMDSPGHRANILQCSYTHIGVGLSSYHWTQNFASH
ncbi:CAP domain-containing protein [Nonomuraea candida]|uniref:CAP domain-containing protein n=1 Tax=Nonomuraea candida TaxID=359159 RepID=UPI001B80718B|nr:CAP domain-containing protein [Nonomuraea candida]